MELTLEDLLIERERRKKEEYVPESESFGEASKRIAEDALQGGASGAAGVLSLIPEAAATVVNIPVAVAERLGLIPKDSGVPSPTSLVREMFGIQEPPKKGLGKFAYNFTEGALPSAAVGLAGGPLVAVSAGALGGAINVLAKELGGDDPYLQSLIAMLPGAPAAFRANMRQRPPMSADGARPSVDPETGALLSPGERSGDPVQLAREESMRRNPQTAGIVSTFDKAGEGIAQERVGEAQNVPPKAILDPEALTATVHGAYGKATNNLIDNFKKTNSAYFKHAERLGGGKELIPTTNVRATVDSLIAGIPEEAINFNSIKSAIKRINDEYNIKEPGGMIVREDGTPIIPSKTVAKKISIEDMQTNLSSWAEAARSGKYQLRDGTNAFGDVAPGQVKGMARKVLWAYKKDLDDAIDAGVPGAEALKQARSKFVENLNKIEEFSGRPLAKYFDENFATALEAEKTVKKLSSLPPSQRKQLAELIQTDYPDAWDGIRVKAYENLRSKMVNEDGSFNAEKARSALKSLDSNEFDYLFATPAEKNKARASVGLLESLERKRSTSTFSETDLKDYVKAVGDTAGALGGFSGKYAVLTVADVVRAALGGGNAEKARAFLTFFPEGQEMIRATANQKVLANQLPKNIWDKFFAMTLAEKASVSSSAGLATTVREQKKEEESGFTLEELLKEKQRRNEQQP